MLDIKIDTADLVKFANRLENAGKQTKPQLADGLNEVGDGLVSVLATDLSKRTGLTLSEVRGMMTVSRANRSSLEYDVSIKHALLKPGKEIEAEKDDTDFGKRKPGELVIVVTAKDDLVCMDCQELEAAGPMPIEIAEKHIPRHPHCRCVIMPYVQKGKRLPVTMTTVSGTDPKARTRTSSNPMDDDLTLRQLAQSILDKTASKIRVELTISK